MNLRGLILLAAVMTAFGCGSTAKLQGEHAPSDLSVELHMATTDLRFTTLELDRNGELRFAGGQAARFDIATEPVTSLTAEQRDAVWRVIRDNQLMAAEGSLLPPKAQKVKWDVKLRAAGHSRRIRCADEEVPGVKALQDLLFKYQGEVRYALPGVGEGAKTDKPSK